jgi:hypothetical protein
MATKKKTKKKPSGSKKVAGKKPKPAQKRAASKKSAKKQKALPKKKGSKKTTRATKPKRGRAVSLFSRDTAEPRSAEQSGDLEGLSRVESADSESVDELVEEGNAFEAGVVAGVEDAGKHRAREVRTREVPEDDVPGEYLDQD